MTSEKIRSALAIIGAGGHGKVVADCARLNDGWSQILFFDDGNPALPSVVELFGMDVHSIDVAIAIGNCRRRQEISLEIKNRGFFCPVIKHPSSIIAQDTCVGQGTVLAAGSIINSGVTLGVGCIINTGAIVDHDCTIGNFVHVATGARLAGGVSVGNRSWIGLGALVREGIKVEKDALIAAGAVVVSDISKGHIAMGLPAKSRPLYNKVKR